MMEHVIIVAGGSGTRMQSAIPKQFIKVGKLPLLMHTISAFFRYSETIKIIIVLPHEQLNYWQQLVKEYGFTITHKVVSGGITRFESVKNGLLAISGEGHVAIHDGVRPIISAQLIDNCFKAARNFGSGVAAVLPKDSIREIKDGANKNLDRNQFRLVQTPQTFELSLIKAAYLATTDSGFSDDASVAEKYGHQITLVAGDYENIKITTPGDIKIAQALLD